MPRALLVLIALLFSAAAFAQNPEFDLIIAGGRIVDGSGNPWYRADLGIKKGHIAAIGQLSGRTATRTIQLHDEMVAPGFIDMMGASSSSLLKDRANAESKLRQGITTFLAGEGDSDAPRNEKTNPEGNLQWHTYGEYFSLLEKRGIAINAVHDIGAAQVRLYVMGDKNEDPTAAQMSQMKELVAQAMRDGVVGVSTALIYPPGIYAKDSEIIELSKTAGQYGGVYVSHMRNESDHLLDAINETITIGQSAGVPTHIFHLKAAGEQNWPLFKDAIQTIQSARDRGMDVTADIYPYIRNGLGLEAFIPPHFYAGGADAFLKTLPDAAVRAKVRDEIENTHNWENWYRHAGKNWDNVLVAQVGANLDKQYEGKSIAQIAKLRGEDEWNTAFDLIEKGHIIVNPISMNEDQKKMALRQEWMSVCNDEEPMNAKTATNAHPRAFGSFPRILALYVREDKVISVEQAIRQMSSLPANFLQLYDRGRIAPGMAADIIVFDPDKVQDTATFAKPLSYPIGIPYVIVNGTVEIDNNTFTDQSGGQILRHRTNSN